MTWLLARSAGVGAYLMLYLSVAWGLLATTSLVTKGVSKRSSTSFHGFVASAGLMLLALHLGALLLDRFVRFDTLDLLVPYRATYRPFALTLGIVAMYAMVIVLATSWTRKHMRPALWRAIHLVATPAFAIALLHGVLAGSDSARAGMAILYWATGFSVLFLVIVRGLTARPPRAKRAAGQASDATPIEARSGGRSLDSDESVRDAAAGHGSPSRVPRALRPFAAPWPGA
jgi:sulfoxide reductase heme-binding subunit YedZ